MDERKETKSKGMADTDIEDVIRRESETALRPFRAGAFVSPLKSRLVAPIPRRRFFLFRKPIFIPALGFLVLAAVALVVFFAPGSGKGRVEAGLRFMTDVLAQSEFFRNAELRFFPGETGDSTPGGTASIFSDALIRVAAEPKAGSAEGGDQLRPLFSPKERFKILYGDRAILRVLTNIANQKEV